MQHKLETEKENTPNYSGKDSIEGSFKLPVQQNQNERREIEGTVVVFTTKHGL